MAKIALSCSYCGKTVFRDRGRVNEAKKFGWKPYCSPRCLQQARDTRVLSVCYNPSCRQTLKRRPKEIAKSGRYFCSQSCAAKVNNQTRAIKRVKKICANPSCYNLIPSGSKYCSSKCAAQVRRIPREKMQEKILAKIKFFVKR